VLARVTGWTAAAWDDALVAQLASPIVLAGSVAAAYPLTALLGLEAPAAGYAGRTLGTLALVAMVWASWRGVGVLGGALRASQWATGNPSAQSALSLGVRVGRVAVLAIGAVAVLARLGYPVAGFVAGLGLGGLAFALAAQKTVENLSYSARDRMRLACTLGLVYGTTAAQMRQVLEGLEGVLRAEFQLIRQEVLLQFMGVVEDAGTSFAFPTRTVHVVSEPGPERVPALA
jgi:MscS family membrane protein